MIRVFIGYDTREPVAFHTLSHSILRQSGEPVSITPLALNQLGDLMWRERNPLQSTEFSFSRFLTPYLCDYSGWALFMDCDMLVLKDLAGLWQLRDDVYSVMCVKHNHVPEETTKFLGAVQTKYEKKNWSSVMLFNCDRCTALTPDYVNEASGLDLHRFHWLESDDQIGEIPHEWNHLVDYDPAAPIESIANLHFTIGGPYFDEYHDCRFSEDWRDEHKKMNFAGRLEN